MFSSAFVSSFSSQSKIGLTLTKSINLFPGHERIQMHAFIGVFLAGFNLSAYIVHYDIIAMLHNTQALAVSFVFTTVQVYSRNSAKNRQANTRRKK